MKRGKKLIGILAFLMAIIILSAIGSAIEVKTPAFYMTAEPVKNTINKGDFAIFNISIQNVQDFDDTFKIQPLEDLKWSFQTVPLTDYFSGKKVLAGETENILMYLKPSPNIDSGTHAIKLEVESDQEQVLMSTVLRVGVGIPVIEEISVPIADMQATFKVPARIDPRNQYSVEVVVKNNNKLVLQNIEVVLTGYLNEKSILELGSNEEKKSKFALTFDKDTKPFSDTINVQVIYKNKTVFTDSKTFEVIGYVPPLTKTIDLTKTHAKTVRDITLTNEGNVAKEQIIRIETTSLEKLFSNTNPEADVLSEGEKQYFTWTVNLEPKETVELKIVTSYRILYWLVILIILALLLFYAFRSSVIIKKSIKHLKREHGALSHAKIIVHVKNRSSKPLKNVRIIERVPKMLKVLKPSHSGTMHPTKTYPHSREGTILEYKLEQMDAYEERIIKYEVKSTLHVVGDITFKPTIVKFKASKKIQMNAKSNVLYVEGPESKK
ncbi:hypothetical protein HN587_01700 [Candidatus Woesearchaeota archaeon]|jgi:hypothetical protein|nr:hypothetical protein [Candidatus Woesearchaeota archaeon]